MSKKNSDLLLYAGLGLAAFFLLKPKKTRAENFDTGFDDAGFSQDTVKLQKRLPGYSQPDIILDTESGNKNAVLQKIEQARDLLETVSNAEVSIKTPKGILKIFKGKRKRPGAKGAVQAKIDSTDIPELLDSVAQDVKQPKQKGRKGRRSATIKTANKKAKNIKKPKKMKTKKPVKRSMPKKRIKAVRVKHLK